MSERTDKFFKILGVLLEPKIRISNDVYLEMLITHLSGKSGIDTDYKDYFKSPKLLEWIEKSVTNWTDDKIPDQQILAFTLRILALLIEDEWQFSLVKEGLILDRIQQVLSEKPDDATFQTPLVHLANVTLLNAVSQHVSGLHWIKQNQVWKVIVAYCEKNHTIYVVRESLTFLCTILKKFSGTIGDADSCEMILSQICQPLIVDNPFKDLKNSVEKRTIWVDDQDKQRQIIPALNTVCYIMQKLVESNDCHDVARIIVEKFNLEQYLWGLANSTQDCEFLGKILKGFVLVNFTKSMLRRREPGHDETDFNKFGVNFFNYMNFCINRRSSKNIIMIAELNHNLWKQLDPPAPKVVVMESEQLKFEDQLIILQILPIMYIIKKVNCESRVECLDSYIIKLFDISCEQNIRLCYSFRDLLRTHDDSTVAHLASKSIQSILSMKNTLHRERAVLVLQALVYALQEFDPGHQTKRNTDLLIKIPMLLSAILTGLHTLIKNYRITWKECIESTVLVNVMLALLSNPNLSTRHAVQALQLMQLSIEHFLAPNLALLVDTLKGSGMENLGPVIYKKLHDNAWEVRDSSLELLTSMVQISDMKFPPFQQHILEYEICPIVYSIAKNDGEFYVKASAMHCLAKMVKIPLFWEKSLATMDLISYLLDVLYTESEGVVRKEATCLLTSIYEQKKIPKEKLDSIFSIMAHSAVNDLFWEVKTNALYFWKVVICRQLQHQGVIDNSFPSVTFSKEHKKIVTLNEKEILIRLTKVLNELSVRGCLGVLLNCLDDSCDLEVVKVTVTLIEKLKSFLDRYNYIDHFKNTKPVAENRSVIDSNYNKRVESQLRENKVMEHVPRNNADVGRSDVFSETILESIVAAQDVNLLVHAYESQMSVDKESKPQIDAQYFKEFAKVSPEEFLEKIVQLDMNEMIKIRSDWIMHIENFDSLLDDILFSFKDKVDINDADCY